MAIHARKRKCDGITVYLIDFTDQNGARRREVAGTTIKQARVKLAQRIGEVRAGTYRPKADAKRAAEAAKGPTFADFGKRFLRDYAATRRSDFYSQRVALLAAREPFKSKRLGDITRADLQGYMARRMETSDGWRKAGAGTMRREFAVLRVMFRCAVRWGVLASSPCDGVTLPKEPRHKVRWLEPAEVERLLAAAPPWLRPILTVAVSSGARLKEVALLRWDEIDTERGLVTLTAEGKTARARVIPLSATMKAALDGVPRRLRCAWVFPNGKGEPLVTRQERTRLSTATRDAAKRAGLPGVGFHTLRHTAASLMVQRGVPLYEVGAILGHSSLVMTERYAHLAPGHLRGAAAALDAALGTGNGGGNDTPVDTRGGAVTRELGGRKAKC